MSHFLRPLLEHRAAQLVNERTGALVAAVFETAFDSATRRRGLLGRFSAFATSELRAGVVSGRELTVGDRLVFRRVSSRSAA